MGKHHHHKTRRHFLRQAGCAALGYTTLFSTLNQLKATNAAVMNNSTYMVGADYKALVCLMLSGGNDSFNMLVPRGDAEYNEYATTRSNQALAQNELLPITPATSDGKLYGLHPSLVNMKKMFDESKVAFLTNVGSLVVPTTKFQYQNGTVDLPLGLYSHVDQLMHWQTSVPQDRGHIGWGGKVADLLATMNTNQDISMNISLSGSNIFQAGVDTVEYVIDPVEGSAQINGYGQPWLFSELKSAGIDSLLAKNHQDIFKKTYVDVLKTSKVANEQFAAALANLTPLTTQFSNNELSNSFGMVAKTIAMRHTLGMKRQIFLIELGGFDNHDEVLMAQANNFNLMDAALHEFNSAMEELGISDCVTTFCISEFGRTLTSNGNGTDHAWGGNVFAMGGAVNGGDIYGVYPSLELNNDLEIGGGVLIPTLSADEYFAELSSWFGVSDSDLTLILPNINNFYMPDSTTPPIGFMNI